MCTARPWYDDPLVLDAMLYRGVTPLEAACAPYGAREYDAMQAARSLRARTSALAESRRRLAGLLQDRGIAQRTPAWYAARDNLITASDAAQALGEGKFGTQREFFEKKLGLVQLNYNIPPIQWGVKYEPVAARLYEHLHGVRLHEFGLLVHARERFLGASPDGINDHGVMVEIKCPYRRRIDGTVPTQYYMQIQFQLDVCDLNDCDYFECEIDEVCDRDEFADLVRDCPVFAGGVATEATGAHEYRYCFGDDACSAAQLYEFFASARARDCCCTMFVVRKHNVVRVTRDDAYICAKTAALRDVFHQLLAYRADPATFVRPTPRRRTSEEGCLFVDDSD